MKQGWEIKKLGEVLVKTEMVDPTKKPEEEFIYLDVSSVNKETKEIEGATVLLGKDAPSRARKLVRANDVIFATVRPTHSRVALITEDYDGQVCSTGYFVLRGKENIDNKYLFYFLLTDEFNQQMEKLQKGASYPAVTDAEVKSIFLRYPKSLPKQQSIVSILDACFAAIDKAKANAEQNLKNAAALFESYLQGVFGSTGSPTTKDGWEEKRFDEICVLQRGFDLPTLSRFEGDYPLVSSNGITDRINQWKVKAPGVVTGRSGTIGNVHFIEEDFWPLNTSLYIKDFHGNYERCIYYFLLQFDLGKYSSGAGVPTLNRNNVHSEKAWFPKSINEQQTIVRQLDALRAETQKLEAMYQKKIDDLEELKKSILQKAFAGELKTEKALAV
jgi:type I restriction enzyme S subunit